MTIKISAQALLIVMTVLAAIVMVAAISYVTETVVGNRGYISCFQRATETEVDAYEKYINDTPRYDSAIAQHQADFVLLERQYIKDIRDC